MRVLIDTSYAARGPSGTGVYIEALVAALHARGEVEVIEARIGRRPPPGGRSYRRSVRNALLDAHWLLVGLPAAARAARADVVHHPLPAYSPRIAVPQVATILDVAVIARPEGFGRVWRAIAVAVYRAAAWGSHAVVCISQATADDAVALLGADPARIVVSHLGPGQAEGAAPRTAEGRDFLYVGDAHERKNLPALIGAYREYRAAAADPVSLVLAGSAAALVQAGEPGVRGAGRPGKGALLELVRGSRALVHPALHEGFGLTLLEAMALGTPVVAVRNRAVEEVCGEAALLVDPAGLAGALARIDTEPALRAALSERGLARAADFSWAEAARLHERAYTLALSR